MKKLILLLCMLALIAPASWGDETSEKPHHSIGHKLLMYIPNRVLDLLDIVRLRVRVGPGLAAGVRVTDPLSVYVGSYVSAYAGLPGPRLEPTIKWPVVLESYNGATLSFLHVATGLGADPGYSPTEIGASLHLLLIGIDVDVDPMEAVDFIAGFFFLDPRGDDL